MSRTAKIWIGEGNIRVGRNMVKGGICGPVGMGWWKDFWQAGMVQLRFVRTCTNMYETRQAGGRLDAGGVSAECQTLDIWEAIAHFLERDSRANHGVWTLRKFLILCHFVKFYISNFFCRKAFFLRLVQIWDPPLAVRPRTSTCEGRERGSYRWCEPKFNKH